MNAVVFALHACPVRALGPYGNEWVATPNLDRLAAEGVVFDRHLSDCPDPAAARRAWLTGRSQVPRRSGESPPVAETPELLALLKSADIRTILVDATRPANAPPPGFYAGFAERFAADPLPDDATPTAALLRAFGRVAESLAGSERFLVWVELDRLVPPWDVPQDVFDAYIEDVFDAPDDDPASRESTLDAEEVLTADDEIVVIDPTSEEYSEEVEDEDEEPEAAPPPEPVRPWNEPPSGWFDRDDFPSWELLHRSFAAAVTTLDAGLGKLFAALTDLGLGDAAWLLTADRGQPLGEHGLIGAYRPWLHEELVQVPLMVRLPGNAGAGRRLTDLTTAPDLMPTLCDLLGVPPPPGLDGRSLMPQLNGEPTPGRPFVVTGLVTETASEWAIRTPEFAYIEPGSVPLEDDPRGAMLFVKPDDRFEVNDVAGRRPEAAEGLAALLAGAVGSAAPGSEGEPAA